MNQKYIVTLIEDERQALNDLIRKGKTQGYSIKHAQILLKLDEIPENRNWTYQMIKEAYRVTSHTISQIAKRFVTGDLKAALGICFPHILLVSQIKIITYSVSLPI